MRKIWTNGCFDILHIGHIKMLEAAKSRGDYLVVGIDSDSRVKELKGKDRPFNNQENRKAFLESIRFVDEVVVFESAQHLEDTVLSNLWMRLSYSNQHNTLRIRYFPWEYQKSWLGRSIRTGKLWVQYIPQFSFSLA